MSVLMLNGPMATWVRWIKQKLHPEALRFTGTEFRMSCGSELARRAACMLFSCLFNTSCSASSLDRGYQTLASKLDAERARRGGAVARGQHSPPQ